MSFRYLPERASLEDYIKSLKSDLNAINEIFCRGEGDVMYEDVFISMCMTLNEMEKATWNIADDLSNKQSK